MQHVLITGGAGYVGAVLTPRLLEAGHRVTVLDVCWYGRSVLPEHERLHVAEVDLRDHDAVRGVFADAAGAGRPVDSVVHLACVSNDPSFELDPGLGKAINLDAFEPLVDAAQAHGVSRFIYASSSSVYGVSDSPDVTEDHPLNPLTDYSRFKAMCEPVLLERASDTFTPVVIRPATVCGYSPRQRLDVIVNILTNHAVHNRKVRVFGGDQLRPNIHIDDMCDCYELLLSLPAEEVSGKVWNAGYHNHPVREIAELVRQTVEAERPDLAPIETSVEPTDDPRSYHVNSDKIASDIGFRPKRTIEDAVRGLVEAMSDGRLPDAMSDERYFNVKRMNALLASAE